MPSRIKKIVLILQELGFTFLALPLAPKTPTVILKTLFVVLDCKRKAPDKVVGNVWVLLIRKTIRPDRCEYAYIHTLTFIR